MSASLLLLGVQNQYISSTSNLKFIQVRTPLVLLPSCTEDPLFYALDLGKQDFLRDWIHGAGNWQMCPKCDEPHDGCQKAIPVAEAQKKADDSPPSDFPISFSQLSSISMVSESCAPKFVYKRRKKLRNSVAIFSEDKVSKTKRSRADSISAVSSEAPALATSAENHIGSQIRREPLAVGAHILPIICNNEADVLRSESTNKCSVREDHATDTAPGNSQQKIIDVDSINDSCSSSKSDVELISAAKKAGMDDVGECSSSSMMAVNAIGMNLSGKDLYISILRSQGLLERVWPVRTCPSNEGGDVCSGSSCFRPCKVCSRSETTSNMLICDNCEEAFHLSCYSPRIKEIPVDEWFCHSCLTTKQKILNETIRRKFPSITSERSRYKYESSECESGPIALMLEDTELYTSNVRVGKGFQADVPDWLGPIDCVDTVFDAMEMDSSESIKLEWTSNEHSRCRTIGNWLQCQQIRDGPGADDGTICGKWRRAPLFEVQTDNWECFCSVLWDPIHADCAVPQELETEQVIKQLKYIEMLRPRLTAKRRKMDHNKSDAQTQTHPLDRMDD